MIYFHLRNKLDEKLSYRKQIAHQQRTHSTTANFHWRVFHGTGAYGTPVVAAAAGSINFSVGLFFMGDFFAQRGNLCDTLGCGHIVVVATHLRWPPA